MAASNDRIVSNGRSKRGRVGFDQSGSAAQRKGQSGCCRERKKKSGTGKGRTDDIPILILMLHSTQRAQVGLFQGDGHYHRSARMRPRGSTWRRGGAYWAVIHSWRRVDRLWCVDCVLLSLRTTRTDGSCGSCGFSGRRCWTGGNCRT